MAMNGGPQHPAWNDRVKHQANQRLLRDPKQQSMMAFHEAKKDGSTRSHYLELFGDQVGFTQLVLVGNLTTVSAPVVVSFLLFSHAPGLWDAAAEAWKFCGVQWMVGITWPFLSLQAQGLALDHCCHEPDLLPMMVLFGGFLLTGWPVLVVAPSHYGAFWNEQ